uniref:Uncharacterized protein n=1 Tax=Anguilla anguilla TaxID=7936 RepID=A0A0E9PNV4_ANGAN
MFAVMFFNPCIPLSVSLAMSIELKENFHFILYFMDNKVFYSILILIVCHIG